MATEEPETNKAPSKLATGLKKAAIVGWGIGAAYFVITTINLIRVYPTFLKHGPDPKNAPAPAAMGIEMGTFWAILIVSWLIYAAGDRIQRKDSESR